MIVHLVAGDFDPGRTDLHQEVHPFDVVDTAHEGDAQPGAEAVDLTVGVQRHDLPVYQVPVVFGRNTGGVLELVDQSRAPEADLPVVKHLALEDSRAGVHNGLNIGLG